MLGLIVWIAFAMPAHAIVMEPILEAAESLGYRVAGELEFVPGTTHYRGMKENLRAVAEFCPRTQAVDRRISTETRFVILAWSDHEYPAPGKSGSSLAQEKLAARRAETVAHVLREHVGGHLLFELVNMTNRKPHMVRVTEASQIQKSKDDVKAAVEIAGGAPSDRLQMGLFGEYAQRSKAVIWVDCYESLVKRRRTVPTLVQLAEVRGEMVSRYGKIGPGHVAPYL